jgi:hypothetical protein
MKVLFIGSLDSEERTPYYYSIGETDIGFQIPVITVVPARTSGRGMYQQTLSYKSKVFLHYKVSVNSGSVLYIITG